AAVTLASAYSSETAFRVTSFQPRVLQPGQRAVVPVRFVPLIARGVTGRLVVTQADQSSVLQVELDGVGTSPDLAVSPTALDFGTADPGRRQTQTLYLTNSGNAPLSVRDLQLSGEGFWVDQAVPLEVAAGQVVPLEVAFLPLSSGSFTGTLRILSDAPGRLGSWEVPLIGVGGGLTLVPRPTVTVAAGAADLLLADWNGDRYPDLTVADSSAGQVKVLLGDGAGGFSSISAYPGPSSVYGRWDGPVALAAAPILSAYPDLIVADRVGRSISILENDGSGRFDHRRSDLYIGYAVADVLTADLDADGDEDIVTANGDTTTLTLLFNDGRGAFNARATRSVESGPVALAAANLNLDGYPDLVVANRRSGTVSVLLNDRGGGFEARQDLLSGLDPVALALVDYDADGDNDILAANQGSWDVAVLANEEVLGETGFRLVHRVRAGMPVADLALSDLTADVFSDLVTVGSGSAQVAFLENEAGSDFVPRDTLVTGEPARRVALADMNADGANDLAILGATSLRLFLNLDARRLDPPRPPTQVSARDVARDLGRQIEVAWTSPELDEQLGRTTEYVVSRARYRQGPYAPIDTVEAGWRSTIDATATLADTFYYYITAGNAALRSVPSDTVWAVSRPAPFFELQLVDEPRISVGDTLKVRAFVTPADHKIAGLSLYLTFEDSALALILPDSASGRRPFRVATQLSGATVLQNQLHPRSSNRIDLSLANLHLDPGVEPVLLGEVWFSTARDTVAFIKIDDEPGENRSSAVVEDVTGEYLLPFIPKEPLQVAVRDYQVRGQVQLLGRGSAALPSSFSLFLVTATGDTLRSPLNDADRLKPGIQGALDAQGQFRLDQIPPGRYQVLAKAPTHLQGRIVGDTVTVGEAARTQLAFRWVGSDSVSHEPLPAGDANDDNQINLADFGVLVRYYGQTTMNQATWSRAQAADFDGDGRITTDDLFLLADYFGEVGMALARAARPAGIAGELSDDGQTVAVRGAGSLTGFSVRLAGTDSVGVDLAGSVWEDREVMVWQWPEGDGRRVVAALRDPGEPVNGEGVLVQLVPAVGAPSLQVTSAELLDAAGGVLPVILSDQVPLPTSPGLLPNYPNPFNPATTIPFVVNAQGRGPVEVRLTIYNALGQRIRTLYDGDLPPGWHRTVWDGLDDQGLAAGTGVYLCRLEVGPFRQTRRLLMIH
ncbi:MAG: FG-GAP-like repeat-containing protein, partial [Candidatus Latescibacterota bacterium]